MTADAGQVSSRQILKLLTLNFSLPFLFQKVLTRNRLEISLNENQGLTHSAVAFANGNTDLPIFEDIRRHVSADFL